jgi:hypothetical protein
MEELQREHVGEYPSGDRRRLQGGGQVVSLCVPTASELRPTTARLISSSRSPTSAGASEVHASTTSASTSHPRMASHRARLRHGQDAGGEERRGQDVGGEHGAPVEARQQTSEGEAGDVAEEDLGVDEDLWQGGEHPVHLRQGGEHKEEC